MSGVPSVIAIDGPGASGKNTVGLLLAQRLGYRFLDTGAMYRAITWRAMELGLDIGDAEALAELAGNARIEVLPPNDENLSELIMIDGHDVTQVIHSPRVDEKVSLVAKVPGVRRALVAQQRRMAEKGSLVMVGRDIGTVVLRHADTKIYLEASPEERARRRFKELKAKGETADYEQVLAQLRIRDGIDQGREDSPLRPAEDAKIVDTDGLTPQEVLAYVLAVLGVDQ